jgi:hypothetical protein
VTFAGAERRLQTCGGLTAQLFDSTSPAFFFFFCCFKRLFVVVVVVSVVCVCFSPFLVTQQPTQQRLFFSLFLKILERKRRRVAKNKHERKKI